MSVALPPPNLPEQVELADQIAFAIMTIPHERWPQVLLRVVAEYRLAIDEAFSDYPEELLDRSASNFGLALVRRLRALVLASAGTVGQA